MSERRRNGREVIVPAAEDVLEPRGEHEIVREGLRAYPVQGPVQRGVLTVRHEHAYAPPPPPVSPPYVEERRRVPMWLQLVGYVVAIAAAVFATVSVAAGPPWEHDAARQHQVQHERGVGR